MNFNADVLPCLQNYTTNSYRQIQGRTGLSHRTVNHSINFVEPITGVHIQNIESYWNVKKNSDKKNARLPAKTIALVPSRIYVARSF